MSRPWEPDHPVDHALARHLLDSQFPDLAGVPLEHLGRGFDADVWRAGKWAFRFPRRRVAVACLEAEMRALGGLAPHLPLPVPVPERFGEPSPAFPAPFYAHRWLSGSSADHHRLDPTRRAALAGPLGRFLRALHGLPLALGLSSGLEADTFRGDTRRSGERALGRLEWLAGGPWASRIPELEACFARPPEPEPDRRVLSHGDLYARHLLLDPEARLCAVIDWGDLCLADPAVDLAIAFTLFPPEARSAFFEAYGPVDGPTRDRARFIALARYGLVLLAYAHEVGDADLAREAGLGLGHALGT